MSQGEAIPRSDALAGALQIVGALETACERIEIAGSLRRHKLEVHDVELVAVARHEDRPDGLFGTESVDLLEERIGELMASGWLRARDVENHRQDGSVVVQHKLGQAFKALSYGEIPVDLFIVRPPATWGCIFALRTGPGTWNTELVTRCKDIGRRVSGGQVERWVADMGWISVPTPEEEDFFQAIGQPWVEPEDRRVERVRILRNVAADAVTS